MTTQGKRTALTRLRGLSAALGLALLVTLGVATPASAGTTVLCTGSSYGTCAAANYSSHGYDTHSDTMYWTMYSGHNCTNYAAYMAIQNGAGTPSHNLGVAMNWDNNAAASGVTVNTTAVVGAIAQWEANAGPATGSGHVAYVEAVDATSITVSEDNYDSGPFSWKKITTGSSDWPSHFIHFADVSAPPPSWGGVGSTTTFQGSDHLSTGQILHANEYVMSSNGQTVLMVQADGNVVLYRSDRALWNSGTGNHPGAYLTVQNDGNIVVYSASNVPLWWTGTTSVTTLTVQTDGNLVGYPATGPAEWQSGTGGQQPLTYLGTDHLSAGDQIHPNQYIRSADGRYFLTAQTDGNIVLYGPGYHVLWTTATGGHPGGAYIVVQNDGNIVAYSATGAALWWTGTTNTAILWLQNDGNLVGRNSADAPTWSSGTGGQI